MKKNKRLIIILIIIIITILGLIIYDNLHYSKREILKIINRVGEDFSNVHIEQERDEEYINEIYSKDNMIYEHTYIKDKETNETQEIVIHIWNFETMEMTSITPADKTMHISKIKGKRFS